MKRENANYISNELTHFAGRGKKSDDERYKLLVEQILKNGVLKSRWVDENPNARCSVSKDQFRRPSANEVVEVPAVCFCDIPKRLLGIHMAKYGKFGLSFKKTFMIANGAYPVFYVADRAQISEPILAIKDARSSEVFDFMFSELQEIDDSMHALASSLESVAQASGRPKHGIVPATTAEVKAVFSALCFRIYEVLRSPAGRRTRR